MTTTKSQVLAILCAQIAETRRQAAIERATKQHPLFIENDWVGGGGGSGLAVVPQSLVRWTQSTEAFRAWAEDWVLRPLDDAVFRLPIPNHFLYVSVSLTLGLLRHSQFFVTDTVCGCVGFSRILLQNKRSGAYLCPIPGVSDDLAPKRVQLWDTAVCCNRKWVVSEDSEQVLVVPDGGGTEMVFKPELIGSVGAHYFSPFNDDVLMLFSSIGTATFWDLKASSEQGHLVVASEIQCRDYPQGMVWIPGGPVCIIHWDYSAPSHLVVDLTTSKEVAKFPSNYPVVPIGTSHIFARLRFLSLARGHRHQSTPTSPTEITFSVHDGPTGLHVGDFTVPHTTDLIVNEEIFM
ncbi:hypothetical protein Pelo_14143 [Pelomyxa schiedti]|nr:hypothetical protein Pelo_14143 [Pelomyxa schiedti]